MKTHKPAWWQLYMLVPIMFLLLAVQHYAPLPGVSDALADTGIVLFTFGAMLVWVHWNGGLFERFEVDEDASRYDLKITVYDSERKTREENKGSDKVTSFVKASPNPRDRGERSVLLKEEDKWFLN